MWLITGRGFPEGNICVRKHVLEKCLSEYDPRPSEYEIWKELNYHFNELGYLSFHISIVANFGRTHPNKLGHRDREIGIKLLKKYKKKVSSYRWNLLLGTRVHYFRNGSGEILPINFSKHLFLLEYLIFLMDKLIIQEKRFNFPRNIIGFSLDVSKRLEKYKKYI